MVNTILKEADLFCPNSVRINFTIYRKSIFFICQAVKTLTNHALNKLSY
ncbi:ABC transporter ATP-binding protein [Lactobacillus rossiae]|uniref:ABC transporter ATP-binding protein n=1 Tax=Furfurilactobacillus milii TaxID=2888272 RepID=A0A6N9I4K6_9LACO|nr:ABC transporter ATP-binding protein [Furfurilactobacillus milii]